MNPRILTRVPGAVIFMAILLAIMVAAPIDTPAQKKKTTTKAKTTTYRNAQEYGYRAGYEDGYTKGKADFAEKRDREIEISESWQAADRGYTEKAGTRINYQEGYRIGFEMGYNDGYFGRTASYTMPANLTTVVVAKVNSMNISDTVVQTQPSAQPPVRPRETGVQQPSDTRRVTGSRRGSVNVPDGIEMKMRLTTQINTRTNKEGDKFLAVVLDPTEYADAVVEGHIAKLKKSGSATGKTELSLAFDSIKLRDGRTGRLAGQVERVYESESVKTIDEEGNVQTGSRTKDTAIRGAGGAVLGAIIGGIAGGGKGAAIGAAIGAGAGAGSVFIEGGKEMILDPGTEILIRTAAPAKDSN